jgi:hypothetical protein
MVVRNKIVSRRDFGRNCLKDNRVIDTLASWRESLEFPILSFSHRCGPWEWIWCHGGWVKAKENLDFGGSLNWPGLTAFNPVNLQFLQFHFCWGFSHSLFNLDVLLIFLHPFKTTFCSIGFFFVLRFPFPFCSDLSFH